jgi:hypothetical protein
MRDYATKEDADFPEPPRVPDISPDFLVNADLYQWAQRVRGGRPDSARQSGEVEEIVLP